jgi:hypothetical protein
MNIRTVTEESAKLRLICQILSKFNALVFSVEAQDPTIATP